MQLSNTTLADFYLLQLTITKKSRVLFHSITGDRLISSSFDGTVRIWNIKTGECVFTLDEHRDRVNKISVSPKDENIFTTAGNDGVVHFWKMNSGQLILSHEGPGRMLNVSFDSNGDKLAATSYSSVNIIPLQYKK